MKTKSITMKTKSVHLWSVLVLSAAWALTVSAWPSWSADEMWRSQCEGDAPAEDNCRNAALAPECSGRGACVCGQCTCNLMQDDEGYRQVISGTYCECDNYSCDRYHNLLCSGPDHGMCECGQCLCSVGWTGSACHCTTANETCVAPGSNSVCNGHGSCECGVCTCDHSSAGQYCEATLSRK